MYHAILFYFIVTPFIQIYVNCTILYVPYISSTVYICDFMNMYFVRNDEINMFKHILIFYQSMKMPFIKPLALTKIHQQNAALLTREFSCCP